MRSLIFVFITLFGFASLNAQTFKGDSWSMAKQTKQANLVVTYTHAPKFAEKSNGQYTGLCFDIIEEFASFVKLNHGVTINLQYKDLSRPMDFDLFLNSVKNSSGGVVGLGDVTITEKRKSSYNFSPAYFSNVAILVSHNQVRSLSSINNISKEFEGMIAIVQNGTTHEARMKQLKDKYFPGLKIETTVSFDEANKKVASNPKYFTYIDFSTYLDVLEQNLPIKRQSAGDQKGESFGFIMPKNSDWGPVFEEFFAQGGGYTSTTEYRKIMADNLGNYVLRLIDAMNK